MQNVAGLITDAQHPSLQQAIDLTKLAAKNSVVFAPMSSTRFLAISDPSLGKFSVGALAFGLRGIEQHGSEVVEHDWLPADIVGTDLPVHTGRACAKRLNSLPVRCWRFVIDRRRNLVSERRKLSS